MALDTYANLQTAIVTWAMRTDDAEFVAAVPDFITLAESRMNRTLRVSDMEATTTLTPVANVCTLPADYLELRSVTAVTTPRVPMFQITRDDLTEAETGASAGDPRFYTLRGSSLKIVPNGTHNVLIEYYKKIPALTNIATSNFILTKAPEIYLFGSLLEAAPFMMDDPRLGVWGQMYERAVAALVSADKQARFGARSTIAPPPTQPATGG
jgi:hypothetical protein